METASMCGEEAERRDQDRAGNVGKRRVCRDCLNQPPYFVQETEVQISKLAYPRPQHPLVIELGAKSWVNLPRAKSRTAQPSYLEQKPLFGSLRH